MKLRISRAGIVAVAIGRVGAVPHATSTFSAAEDIGRSTMDIYPPAGSELPCSPFGQDTDGLVVAAANSSLFSPESVVGFPGRKYTFSVGRWIFSGGCEPRNESCRLTSTF